ncbi:hypothetical protein A2755_00255 [Candidatus Wolfebacteria bacterium RIFCSPHIGHO2_01_FULL_48_22]|uniref:TVP38/TMEM64 family membrane protein n=1 Tax=Candidatus Wolfebacteria bacterium RIFCSPHIGHO2_01_FULL_48_22 TaxID=1802555 RepID=A0A1F8DVB6_9BACT|nr:MAG: hypothetical protein A2755_00255 [Candidatus Wolfebacteria bacterium RIFCSPHIGHO2_01_FULL_48_22]
MIRKELFKLLGIFIAGIVIVLAISRLNLLDELIRLLSGAGVFGPMISGIFFVFTITVATGASLLTALSETYPISYVAIWGGFGAAIGDVLFFHVIRRIRRAFIRTSDEHVIASPQHIFKRIEHSPLGRFLLPIVGAVIIASPLPDELGIALLGLSKMNRFYFFLLSYTLNTIGIYLLLLGISLLT